MDKAGRKELHRACSHKSCGRCPVEAAEAVTWERFGVLAFPTVVESLWLVPLVAWVYFPNWIIEGRFGPIQGWLQLAIIAGCSTVVGLAQSWKALGRIQSRRALARSGPD
jgi:hypothetical protein